MHYTAGHLFVDSAKEAYQRIFQQRFDVIVSDIQMPEFSGIDLIQWIKEDPAANDGIPIYACTANATEEALTGFKREGFDGVLTKPVTLAELEGFVNEHIVRIAQLSSSSN